MLRIENISTGYGKKQVLFDISLEINKGETVLLAGSNGSGKSTLLKVIYGLLPVWKNEDTHTYGTITFNGEQISHKGKSLPSASLLKKGLLYLPQKNNLFEDLTVRENLEMAGLMLRNRKLLRQRIDHALAVFPSLVPHLRRAPMKLSGGERQLLTLAMAMLHQPQLLMLDEPFTGLSSQNIALVIESLERLKKESGITLIIVEHRVKECATIADKVVGLKLGKVFSTDTITTQFNMDQLHAMFI